MLTNHARKEFRFTAHDPSADADSRGDLGVL